MGLVLAFGLVLFLFTRDETVDALEAETYEAMHPGRSRAGQPGRRTTAPRSYAGDRAARSGLVGEALRRPHE